MLQNGHDEGQGEQNNF